MCLLEDSLFCPTLVPELGDSRVPIRTLSQILPSGSSQVGMGSVGTRARDAPAAWALLAREGALRTRTCGGDRRGGQSRRDATE